MESMTADVTPLRPRRLGDDANDTVRSTIRAVMAGRDLKADELAPRVGMSGSTLYRKLAARGQVAPFTAGEIAEIAAELKVEVGDLFAGRVVLGVERSVNNRNLTFPAAVA